MSEETLFERALNLPAGDRAAFLDRECAGDAGLRARLGALLAAHLASSSPLDRPVVVPDCTGEYTPQPVAEPRTTDRERAGKSGVVIAGRYTLVEKIGEGGMGEVWVARQTEPVKRKVALKLIKAGMDSRQVLARFEAERQALALMDHPNIATVLDGGLHELRPYFVMELVKGVPITEYCDTNKLTPQQRLELFVQACQAIQHAHQKGIIHRDIKPSNVLVARYDDRPVVKVIDFGVAKATGGTLTEATIDTGFGGVVGTPQYMSPEQATFNNLDIDTRSDVYALGVLLYELLVGSPPFSGAELKKKGLLEVLRVVREEDPPRPSTKLSTADALPSLSASRGTEPKKLTSLLRSELDWIVMKALEKDRTRRYETANGFAADVQRYLAGEPVQAHPPSMAYRLKKFVKRNKVQVIAASLVLLVLVAGIVGTTLGLIEANKQKSEAKRLEGIARAAADKERLAKEEAETRRLEAEAKRKEAETNLKYTREGHKVLFGIFARMTDDEATKANLQQAAKDLEMAVIGDPVSTALIRAALADALIRVRDPQTALRLYASSHSVLTRQLGPDHPDTLECSLGHAWVLSYSSQHDRSIALYEDTLVRTHAVFGPRHQRTAVARYRYGVGCARAGRHDAALDALEDSVPQFEKHFGRAHLFTLEVMRSLLGLYADLPMGDEATDFLWLVKKRYREPGVEGDEIVDLFMLGGKIMPFTGTGFQRLLPSSTPQSVKEANRVYNDLSTRLGPLHPESLLARRQLAETLRRHPRANPPARAMDEPETILFELADAVREWKIDHPFRVETARLLGDLYASRQKQHPESWRTFRARSRYGDVLLGLQKYAEAEQLLVEGYQGLKVREPFLPEPARAAIPEALDRLIELYTATKKPDEVKKSQELRAKYPATKEIAPMPKEKEKK